MIGAGRSLVALALAALGSDYRLESSDWNGLSTVAAAAAAAGCPIEAHDRIEWNRLTGNDVLWIVYPRSSLDGVALAQFLDAGGRALIADDFGGAEGALFRLGISRRAGTVEADHYLDDQVHLPVAIASMATPLGRAAPTLVTNHPAYFVTRAPATFQFAPGAAAVVEGRLGRGSFVALADPSVLINNMQQLDADRRFAEALLAVQCRPHIDHILLFTGEIIESGRPLATLRGAPDALRPSPTDRSDRVRGALANLNDLLASVDDAPPATRILTPLAVAAVVVALLLLARALPVRDRVNDGAWTRTRGVVEEAAAPRAPSIARSAIALRDELRLRMAEALGEPAAALHPDEAAEAITVRFGSATGARAIALWRELDEIAQQVGGLKSRPRLERLHRQAIDLFAALESPTEGAG